MLLSFELPGLLGVGLTPGPFPDLIGVMIHDGLRGHVTVTGRNEKWLYEQAAKLLKALAPRGIVASVFMRLTRENAPGPTISGPYERGGAHIVEMSWDGKSAQLITKSSMRPVLTRAEERRRGDPQWLQFVGRARPF